MKLKIEELKTSIELESVKGAKVIKNNLNVGEIAGIVIQMLNYDSYIQRQMVKNIAILKLCTDIENIQDDDASYDYYFGIGLVDEVLDNVKNEYLVDMQLEEELSVGKSIRNIEKNINMFLQKANDTMDKVGKKLPKNGEWNKIVEQFKTMVNK